MNDRRPPAELAPPLDLCFQLVEAAHGAGDGVLRAAQVEVHDLKKFASIRRDFVDERGNVGVVEVDLRRPDRGQPVVRLAQVVARNDVVHLAAAVKHHLQQRLEFVGAGHACERGVFTDGMPACDRALDERALLAHLGHLRGGHGRHRDLGELRQVQHALGVLVVHTDWRSGWSGCRAPRAAPRSPACRG